MLNQRYSGEFKLYNHGLPKWLHNLPHTFVDHVRMPLDGSLFIPREAIQVVNSNGATTFSVNNESDKSTYMYKVYFGDDNNMPLCSCRDWAQHHLPCKHMCAIFHHYAPTYSWESLSPAYRLSSYFFLDNGESAIIGSIPSVLPRYHAKGIP